MDAVFPCVLRILPTAVFNKKDPIILGVDILEGIAKVGSIQARARGSRPCRPQTRRKLSRVRSHCSSLQQPASAAGYRVSAARLHPVKVVTLVQTACMRGQEKCLWAEQYTALLLLTRAGAQVGTPLCVPSQGGMDLGRIASLELNHKPVDSAKVRLWPACSCAASVPIPTPLAAAAASAFTLNLSDDMAHHGSCTMGLCRPARVWP